MNSKGKRTVKCGVCQASGHNARTCQSRGAVATAAPVGVAVSETASSDDAGEPASSDEPALSAQPIAKKTKIDMREAERPRREAPTGDRGTAATAAPFRCTKCNQVAILVIVRVRDHAASLKSGSPMFKGEQRCELCMNKPDPADLILKWGAAPGETVPAAEVNRV